MIEKKSRIPTFSTHEEEAAFWDTHEITEFLDELTPVKVRFAKNLSEEITIPLDSIALRMLDIEAHKKGVDSGTLARMWIMERLRGQGS